MNYSRVAIGIIALAWGGLVSDRGKCATRYTITDLGAIPLDNDILEWSTGVSINNLGEVVGENGYPTARAFRWTNDSGIELIDDLPGVHEYSVAFGINELSQVIGLYGTLNDYRPFIWDAIHGGRELTGLVDVRAINNRSQVAGGRIREDGYGNAVLWDAVSGAIDLNGDSAGLVNTGAIGINEKSQIVGTGFTSGGRQHAFFWDPQDGMERLPEFASTNSSYATDINEAGQVTGTIIKTNDEVVGFTWTKQLGLVNLGHLPGTQLTVPTAINDSGQVVGRAGTLGTPFIWDAANGIRNLSVVVEASRLGWDIIDVNDINNRGQITGRGGSPDGKVHAFVLTPSPLGDTDEDGDVDIEDLNNVRNDFGASGPGDTDDDADIDIVDLNNVRNNFGTSEPAVVPEPSTDALAAIGLIGMAGVVRRRKRC